MSDAKGDLTTRSHAALEDATLQAALGLATATFVERRRGAIAEVEDWEALRERGRLVKEHTIAHLDVYLERLAERVERHGGTVHWASTAEDACRYVRDLARSRGVRSVVKGKSMVTEEIELNRALEAAGVAAVETDLGEYIIQLAGETPSHIIVPAIHKTRGQIADLFAEALRVDRPADVEAITAVARERLRAGFLAADMGITGANFAVAETGTIVLVENEGNIRLSTLAPRIHVAVVGIEKVVPRFDDLSVFLRLLARSATGQSQTAYVSFLNGPRRSEEDASELHLVLLDNGRTRILADERMREALGCIRCGACLNVCPVYQRIGGQAYGWIYPGPIGAVITPMLRGLDRGSELPFASTLCGACRDVCPVKIDLPDLLLELRSKVKARGARTASPFGERTAMRVYAALGTRPRLFAVAGAALRGMAGLASRGGRIRRLRLPALRAWTRTRDLPAPRDGSFRAWWRKGGRHG
jgi:L-lactate dehydrogenase complex protein LldF